MKIKNIIFDFDGVLVENTNLLLETHRNHIGWISNEEYRELFDQNTMESIKKFSKENLDLFWKKWKEVLNESIIEKKAKEFLKKNSEKKKYIISSNDEIILEKIIKNSNLEKCFEKVLGKNTHSSKIEKFLILQNTEKINLSESIFITDSLGDLKEASYFPELKTIAVTFGVHDRERLKQGNPDYIIDSWDELENLNIL